MQKIIIGGKVLRYLLLSLILCLWPVLGSAKESCEDDLLSLHWQISAAKQSIKPQVKRVRQMQKLAETNPALSPRLLRYGVGQEIVDQSLTIAAVERDEILVYRSFNPNLLFYLADEDISPKAMLPIKSADRGLAAGLIPYDVRRSKIGGQLSPKEVAQKQNRVDELIASGVLRKVPLVSYLGRAVIRKGFEIWTHHPKRGDKTYYILADSLGRRLVSDVDLFDVGRKETPEAPTWSEKRGWVNPADEETLDAINTVFKKLHPGHSSPELVPHGAEMRRPYEAGFILDFPLHAIVPGMGKVRILRGDDSDPLFNLRAFVSYFNGRGFQFSPNLMRLLFSN